MNADDDNQEFDDFATQAGGAAVALEQLVGIDPSQFATGMTDWLDWLEQNPDVVRRHSAESTAAITMAWTTGEPTADPRDKRFADAEWRDNPYFRRLLATYLVAADRLRLLVEEADIDVRAKSRTRFAVEFIIAAGAPTNSLATNPAAIRRMVETEGASLVKGARHFLDDMSANHGLPSQADVNAFEVGRDVAATPGSVVHRTEMFELLQYRAATPKVHERPILICPSQVNRFYTVDMSPGRSLVQFMVGRGHTVLSIVWRNPEPQHRHWDYDAYLRAYLEAIEVTLEISGADAPHVVGACGAGTLTALLLAHLSERNAPLPTSATYLATAFVSEQEDTMGHSFADQLDTKAIERSEAAGVVEGHELQRAFAMLRPDEGIWTFWVNNYLMGQDPPAFDILFWNSFPTRLPAALHRDMVETSSGQLLATPGATTALGSPVDLSSVDCDTFVVAGAKDHICAWQDCYGSARLLGGPAPEFVLSRSGHIAAIVSPPGRTQFRHGPADTESPAEWAARATVVDDSWWPHWAEWLEARSSGRRSAPPREGSAAHPVMDAAPGQYVLG